MPGILGRKIGMTRIMQDDGRVIPITVVQCTPNTVTQVKTTEKDGYPAIVLGFAERKKSTKNKKFYFVREFKIENENEFKKGDTITVEILKEKENVEVTGTSKGKGFQGVIKRHHFSSGPETHGSHQHREPGSIGARAKPGRVHKGKRMAGRMGHETVTLKNIPIIHIDPNHHLIALQGSLPGPNKGLIQITI